MSKAKQRIISIIVISLASIAGLLVQVLLHAAWYGVIHDRFFDGSDKQPANPSHYVLRAAWFALAPFVAGLAGGLVAAIFSRSRRFSRAIWAAIIQVAFVTLWWARLGEFSWRTDFVYSREWQLLVLCLPIGAIVIPLVIGLFRRDKTPLQNDANLPNDSAR